MTKGKTNAVRQTAHIIPHTHWDREWYLPYETPCAVDWTYGYLAGCA